MHAIPVNTWPAAGHIKGLAPAVAFHVASGGALLTAILTKVENNYTGYLYHITLSDGRKAELFYDEEEKLWDRRP